MIETNIYTIVYVLLNAFRMYTVYRFMDVFYERRNRNQILIFAAYIIYFSINTGAYLVLNIPMLTMLSNILGLLCLTFLYDFSLKKNILVVLFITILGVFIDSIFVVLDGNTQIKLFIKFQYIDIWYQVAIQLVIFIIMQMMRGIKNVTQEVMVPTIYWCTTILIPFATIGILLIIVNSGGISAVGLITCIGLFLLINISVFELYAKTLHYLNEINEKNILQEHNEYYRKQIKMMEESSSQIRSIRHDMRNHIYAIKTYADKHSWIQLQEYIDKLDGEITAGRQMLDTGNTFIDSMLNFKLNEAERKNITIQKDLCVSNDIKIDSYDLTVVLGNLLDNAIEAVQSEMIINKWIAISIRESKGILKLSIKNPYNGLIKKQKNTFLSIKREGHHGYGLSNVEKVVQKYGGTFAISTDNNIFAVNLKLIEN